MTRTRQLLLLGLLSASSTFSAVTLIDANIRNGSFEAGDVPPWLGNLRVVHDEAFASHGEWYGVLEGMPPAGISSARKLGFQFISANRTNGQTFVTAFDARTGTPGFDSIGVQLVAGNTNGILIGTTPGPVTVSNLSATAWTTYQLEFELNDDWDGIGPVSLQLLFQKAGNAVAGTTYTGYLDNVKLRQTNIPRLKVAITGSSRLTLFWRTNAPGFLVQSANTPSSTNWSAVTAQPSVFGSNYTMTIGMTGSHQFFRLKR